VAEEDINRPDESKKTQRSWWNGGDSHFHPSKQARKVLQGPLTFSPTPSLDEAELLESSIQADNDQAKLMRRNCWLCHLPFNQLKELAKNGEIPKKVPWHTKGSNPSQQVFKATIDQDTFCQWIKWSQHSEDLSPSSRASWQLSDTRQQQSS
jgi:hypothetical protein